MPRRRSGVERGSRPLTIGEIARRVGVSRSTVSYALSGNRPISEATRQRVQEVIAELDYRPNAHARALKEGRTRSIGLVIPPAGRRLTDMQLSFVAYVVDAAARADLDVLISSSGGDHDRSFERIITGSRVDGVIVMEIRMEDARVVRLQRIGLPFVAIGRPERPGDLSWVDVDTGLLVARCVHHLADLGHRHVALINRSAELVAIGYGAARRAQRGFAAAIAERGMVGSAVSCADDVAGGQACIEQLLAARPRLTAVVTINEAALPGVWRALERRGRVVPRDFSVTGLAAAQWAEDLEPALTAADVPAIEMCTQALDLLRERIAEPQRPHRHVLLAPSIRLRGSTGPAPRR